MPIAHNLGFPPLGAGRELKRATESYWNGKVARDLPVPVALGSALQLAPGSEGREAEIVGNRHREGNLPREGGVGSGPKTPAPGRPSRPGAWAAAPCGAPRVCGGAALPALAARRWDSDPEPAPPRAPARWPPAPA